MKALLDPPHCHKEGETAGTFKQALQAEGFAVIVATSNQVIQEGLYTGMRLAVYRNRRMAPGPVVLGGDHLGPNCRQSGPAEVARVCERTIQQFLRQYGYACDRNFAAVAVG